MADLTGILAPSSSRASDAVGCGGMLAGLYGAGGSFSTVLSAAATGCCCCCCCVCPSSSSLLLACKEDRVPIGNGMSTADSVHASQSSGLWSPVIFVCVVARLSLAVDRYFCRIPSGNSAKSREERRCQMHSGWVNTMLLINGQYYCTSWMKDKAFAFFLPSA